MGCGNCLRFTPYQTGSQLWLGHCRVHKKNVSAPDCLCHFYIDEHLVKRFTRLFVSRGDTYAQQREDGSYLRVEQPLTSEIFKRHLAGDITIGTYQINPVGNTVKWICFDVDPKHVKDPQQVALTLHNESVWRFSERPVLLEASRWPDPSFHVWVFFEPEFPARAARWLGRKILEYASVVVELFPKQDQVNAGDFGNLMKLPCGYHRQAKKWSTFLIRQNSDRSQFSVAPSKILERVEGVTFTESDTERILKLADKETSNVQIKLGIGTRTYRWTRAVRPCFKEALSNHGLPHDMRLALAIEYLTAGYDAEKVTALFREQKDYDEHKARYQVEHAQKRGYSRRKCVTIQALGFCIGESCPIFRRRQKRFEKAVEDL